MPENKKQHFVPKSVLRYFAADAERKSINLINIKRGQVIRNASLRNQCYRDYLYGEDPFIENVLGDMEGQFAWMVKRILAANKLEARFGQSIASMISLQRSRTTRAIDRINQQAEKFAKLSLHGRIAEDVLRGVKITLTQAAALSMGQSLALSPMLLDLKRILLINRTPTPFVISDNPVVLTNWFGRRRFPGRSLVGLANSGLQLALPLSPHHALLLHDSNAYIAATTDSALEVFDPRSIDGLNDLQWLNAERNIYVPPTFNEGEIARLMALKRDETLFDFHRMEEVAPGILKPSGKDEYARPNEGITREFMIMGGRGLPSDIRVKGISLRSKPKFFDDGSMASPLRDVAWHAITSDFGNALTEQTITYNEFWTFATRHPLFSQVGPWLDRDRHRSAEENRADPLNPPT